MLEHFRRNVCNVCRFHPNFQCVQHISHGVFDVRSMASAVRAEHLVGTASNGSICENIHVRSSFLLCIINLNRFFVEPHQSTETFSVAEKL